MNSLAASSGPTATPTMNDRLTTATDDEQQRPSGATGAALNDHSGAALGTSKLGDDSMSTPSSGDTDQGRVGNPAKDIEQIRDKWVVNLSEELLTEAENSVLRNGLNIFPTPKSVNSVDFITEVEKLISKSSMSVDEINKIRFEVTKALQSFRPDRDNLTVEERRALHGLRERKNLMILPSDKGKSACILTTEQYRSRINDLISDTDTYEQVQRDPTPAYARKVREALSR